MMLNLIQRVKVSAGLHRNIYKLVKEYGHFLDPGIYAENKFKYKKGVIGFPIVKKKEIEKNFAELADQLAFPEQTEIQIVYGGWSKKIVCIYDDFVASYYDSSRLEWFNNISRFYNVLPYPKVKYLYINKEKLFILCEKVKGDAKKDIGHAKRAIDRMLDGMINSYQLSDFYKDYPLHDYDKKLQQFEIKNYYSCVQHADASIGNILWENENDFKFIDLDTISICPLLSDMFRILLTEFGKEGLQLYLSGEFDEKLNCLFKCFGETFDLENKDKYLAIFYIFSHGRWKDDWSDYSFGDNFIFTNKVIVGLKA